MTQKHPILDAFCHPFLDDLRNYPVLDDFSHPVLDDINHPEGVKVKVGFELISSISSAASPEVKPCMASPYGFIYGNVVYRYDSY